MSAVAATAPLPEGRAGWIGSPGWDLFWMFSTLWGAALLLGGSLFVEIASVALALFFFDRTISVAHAWSTTTMVLFSPLWTAERRNNPRKYVYVPLAIAVGSLLLGLYVAAYQRFPADGRLSPALWGWALYVGLFWVGHFWHFGNQDFGVLSIYRAKAGQTRLLDRRVDKLYTATMMFAIQPIVYLTIVRTTGFAEDAHSWLPLSQGFMDKAAAVCIAAVGLLSLAVVAFELSKPNRSVQKLLYYGVIFLHPVLFYAAATTREVTYGYLFALAYFWSHWFIAIGLVSRINTHYYERRGSSPGVALVRHAALLAVVLALVWLVTHDFGEYLLFNTGGFRYKEVLAGITPGRTPVIGLLLGFFLGEQLIHYYCDRCLFRFRDPAVRRTVAPLL